MAAIKLPDGIRSRIPDGTTVGQLAESIGGAWPRRRSSARWTASSWTSRSRCAASHDVSIVTDRDPDGLFVMRHSTAHVLAQALRRLYGRTCSTPSARSSTTASTTTSSSPTAGFSVEDLPKVEKEMQKIVEQQLPFTREDVTPPRAKDCCRTRTSGSRTRSSTSWKRAARRAVSIYPAGRVHRPVPRAARAAHREDQGVQAPERRRRLLARRRKREQLTRIYGTAFFD
jgi:threonyl-tRNA synthetase